MTAALQGKAVETFPPPAYVGETVNPQPTFTPSPTKSTETPSETPTVVPTTPLPTTPLPTTPPGPPSTPPGQSSPTDTVIISPPPA